MSMTRGGGTNDELELRLAGLAPTPAAVDRDRLMFEAGLAAAAARFPSLRLWKASTGLMTAATVMLAVTLAMQTDKPPQLAEMRETAERSDATSSDPAPLVDETPVDEQPIDEQPIDEQPIDDRPRFAAALPPLRWGDPATNYLALREVVLSRGVDAWQVATPSFDVNVEADDRRRAATVRELMQEFLPQHGASAPSTEEPQPMSDSLNDEERVV